MNTLRLYIVRHGVTVWNNEARLQGHTDIPLSPEGEAQAKRLAERLSGERIQAVWSSDLRRAMQTAEIVAQPHNVEIKATPLLRESMLGDWEGLTEDEILARGDAERFSAYRRDSLTHRPPNGERLEEVQARILSVLGDIRSVAAEGTVAVIGHGGSLRVILADALGAPLSALRHIWLDNASLSLVEYGPERTWVKLLNDTSHLVHR